MVLLDHGHADDLLGAVDRDERDAMRCPNCQDTHVTGLGVTPGTRVWECLNCGYIWPRDAARLERVDDLEFPAYVKYDAVGITALICKKCVTVRERELENCRPVGILPLAKSGVVVCERCKEVAE